MRSEAASTSSTTTLAPVIAKAKTTRGTPPGAQTAPGEPSMSAGRAAFARPQKACATASAPSSSASLGAPGSRVVALAASAEHDAWREHREQRVEIAVPGCGQEGFDDCTFFAQISVVGSRGAALYSAPRAARELPRGTWRAPDDGRDILEAQVE
jgi:hypothetical protein